jgi:hypothetical protein
MKFIKFLTFLLLAVVAITSSSCARGCSSITRSVQVGDMDYEIIMYSGGDTVFYDKVRTIINNSESSDGIYYYKGDTLVEVSGDYVIKATE